MSEYNGWANRQTWNVSLWLNNDEGLYSALRHYARWAIAPTYRHFADSVLLNLTDGTPDGVAWNDADLDLPALDEMIAEVAEEFAQ